MPADADANDNVMDLVNVWTPPTPSPPTAVLAAQVGAVESLYAGVLEDEEPPALATGAWDGGESSKYVAMRAAMGLDPESFAAAHKAALEAHTADLLRRGVLAPDATNGSTPAAPAAPAPAPAAAFLEVGAAGDGAAARRRRHAGVRLGAWAPGPPDYATAPDVAYGMDAGGPPSAVYVFGGGTANGVVFSDHYVLHFFPREPPSSGSAPASGGGATAAASKAPAASRSSPAPSGGGGGAGGSRVGGDFVAIWEHLVGINSGPVARVGAAAVTVTSNPDESGVATLADAVEAAASSVVAEWLAQAQAAAAAAAAEAAEAAAADGAPAPTRTAGPAPSGSSSGSSKLRGAKGARFARDPNAEMATVAGLNATEVAAAYDVDAGRPAAPRYVFAPNPAPAAQWVLLFGGAQRSHPVVVDAVPQPRAVPLPALLEDAAAAVAAEEAAAIGV